MNFTDILLIGIVATSLMTAVYAIITRVIFRTVNIVYAVGSFIVQRPFKNPFIAALSHYVAGCAFATLQIYVFEFLALEGAWAFIKTGIGLGILHGFLVGFLFLAFHPEGGLERFDPTSGMLNVCVHIIFGLAVGTGAWANAYTANFVWFVVWGLLVSGALLLLATTVGPWRPVLARLRVGDKRLGHQ